MVGERQLAARQGARVGAAHLRPQRVGAVAQAADQADLAVAGGGAEGAGDIGAVERHPQRRVGDRLRIDRDQRITARHPLRRCRRQHLGRHLRRFPAATTTAAAGQRDADHQRRTKRPWHADAPLLRRFPIRHQHRCSSCAGPRTSRPRVAQPGGVAPQNVLPPTSEPQPRVVTAPRTGGWPSRASPAAGGAAAARDGPAAPDRPRTARVRPCRYPSTSPSAPRARPARAGRSGG